MLRRGSIRQRSYTSVQTSSYSNSTFPHVDMHLEALSGRNIVLAESLSALLASLVRSLVLWCACVCNSNSFDVGYYLKHKMAY